jgi:hypothetical protein
VREGGKGWARREEGKERQKDRRELSLTYDPI